MGNIAPIVLAHPPLAAYMGEIDTYHHSKCPQGQEEKRWLKWDWKDASLRLTKSRSHSSWQEDEFAPRIRICSDAPAPYQHPGQNDENGHNQVLTEGTMDMHQHQGKSGSGASTPPSAALSQIRLGLVVLQKAKKKNQARLQCIA